MKRMIRPGAHVAYSAAWLRSIGCRTGDLPAARGTVTKIQQLGSLQLATVDWGSEDIPARVAVCNLALVGPNTKF